MLQLPLGIKWCSPYELLLANCRDLNSGLSLGRALGRYATVLPPGDPQDFGVARLLLLAHRGGIEPLTNSNQATGGAPPHFNCTP